MNRNVLLIAVVFGFCGTAFILGVTGPFGPSISWDSVCYVQAAKFLSMGEGFCQYSKLGQIQPLIHYPPLYPLALAAGPFFGMDIVSWARILGACLFGVNIFLLSGMAFYLMGRVRALVLAGVLALTFVYGVEFHAAALSEPLFIMFLLMALWAFIRYFEKESWGWLIGAAVLSSACLLTRYAGLSVIVTGTLVLMLAAGMNTTGWQKARAVGVYLAVALAFPLVWLIRNLLTMGRPFGSDVGFFGGMIEGLRFGVNSMTHFLLPAQIPFVVRAGLLLAVIVFAVPGVRKFYQEARAAGNLRLVAGLRVIGCFLGIYLFTEVAGMIFSNGLVSLERRLLLPLPITMIPLAAVYFSTAGKIRWKNAGTIIFGFFMLSMAVRTAFLARDIYREGRGCNGRAWAETGLVKTVKTLADHVLVYTNDTQAFYFYTGRPSIEIPSAGRDASYLLPIADTRRKFLSRGAVAVIFQEKRFMPHPVWWTLVREVPLTAAFRDGWGTIYAVKRSMKEP